MRTVAATTLMLALTSCSNVTVLEGLDERQANEVVAMLLRQNIAAEKTANGKAGYAVEVDSESLVSAIDLIRQNDLPSAVPTQVSNAFPADAMVSTPLSEKARLLSAVERRLEESLTLLDGVRAARVHVSYDNLQNAGTGGAGDSRPRHVAVVLRYEPGVHEASLVQNSKRFLRNAFDGMSYDDISVILAKAETPRVIAVTEGHEAGNPWRWAGVAGMAGVAVGLLWLLRNGLARLLDAARDAAVKVRKRRQVGHAG